MFVLGIGRGTGVTLTGRAARRRAPRLVPALLCHVTYSVDSRQLLRELQHDGNEDGLAVQRGAEQLQNGDLLLPHHLLTLILHLLHVLAHLFGSSKLRQGWKTDFRFCQSAGAHVKLPNSPLRALLSSLQLIRRYRGLSGHMGSRTHCRTAGSRVNPRRRGHMDAFPMMASIPKTYMTDTPPCSSEA